MIDIDLDNLSEETVYKAFIVVGNADEALCVSFLDLF